MSPGWKPGGRMPTSRTGMMPALAGRQRRQGAGRQGAAPAMTGEPAESLAGGQGAPHVGREPAGRMPNWGASSVRELNPLPTLEIFV